MLLNLEQRAKRDLIDAEIYARAYHKARGKWLYESRQGQIAPAETDSSWNVQLWLAGRGWGKTRTGSEDCFDFGWRNPGSIVGIGAPTAADIRDVCFEGPAGLLSIIPEILVAEYNRSLSELYLINGTSYKGYSMEKPEGLRGKQFHRFWSDELAAARYGQDFFDQLDFCLRLGAHPRHLITTTPRPSKLMRSILARDWRNGGDVAIWSGSTFDNEANLPASFIQKLRDRFEGSALGRQELYAELIADVKGALWTLKQLDDLRIKNDPIYNTSVVAIDPATTSNEESDATGIVGVGKDYESGKGFILGDWSMESAKPIEWAKKAIEAYYQIEADAIVAEGNQGGEMISTIINQLDPKIPVHIVHASVGKYARAEPVSTLYSQGRIHHVGTLAKLEDEMTTYVPGDPKIKKSPDRLDALVWGVTYLFPIDKKLDTRNLVIP